MSLQPLFQRDPSGSIVVVGFAHNKTHNGEMYHVSGKITGILDAGVQHLLIHSGTPEVHLNSTKFSFGRGDIDILLYENVVTSADGTLIPTINLNRESANTSTTLTYKDPTITDQGDLIHTQWFVPTSAGVGQSPGGTDSEGLGEEWILDPATKYDFVITNNSGSTIDMWFEFLYYTD